MKEKGKNMKIDDKGVTSIDLQKGCLQVRDSLQRYNRKCERTEGAAMYIARRYWYKITNDFTYKNAANPTAGQIAALKCKAIHSCPMTKPKPVTSTNSQIKWAKVKDQISDIIAKVDDYGAAPQAYNPFKATDMIMNLVNAVTESADKVEAEIAEASEIAEGQKIQWGDAGEKVFADELWDDRCFDGLTDSGMSGAIGLLKDSGKYTDSNHDFFFQLADYLKLSEWSTDLSKVCVRNEDKLERPVMEKAALEGPKIVVYMKAEPKKFEQMWKDGKLELRGIDSFNNLADKNYSLRLAKHESDWHLAECFLGVHCNGVARGVQLVKMDYRYVAGDTVKKFIDSSVEIMNSAETINDELAKDERYTAFGTAADFFDEWVKAVSKEIAGKKNSTLIKDESKLKTAKEKLSKTDELKKFCTQRGWKFTDPKKTDTLMMFVDGRPLEKLRQLRTMAQSLRQPAYTPLAGLRTSIIKTAWMMLKNTDKQDLWSPDSDQISEGVAQWKDNKHTLVKLNLQFERTELSLITPDLLSKVAGSFGDDDDELILSTIMDEQTESVVF